MHIWFIWQGAADGGHQQDDAPQPGDGVRPDSRETGGRHRRPRPRRAAGRRDRRCDGAGRDSSLLPQQESEGRANTDGRQHLSHATIEL